MQSSCRVDCSELSAMCNRVTEVWLLVVILPPPSTRTCGVVVLSFLSKPRCRPCKELISLFVETTADITAIVVAVAFGGVSLHPFGLGMWGTGGNLHVLVFLTPLVCLTVHSVDRHL